MSKKSEISDHLKDWNKKFEKEVKVENAGDFLTESDEGINIKPIYTHEDFNDLNFIDPRSLPGDFPYTLSMDTFSSIEFVQT